MVPNDDLIRGPKWRTRTTPGKRRVAAAITLAVVVAVGVALMAAAMWLLDALGAPAWVVVLPWLAPTIALTVWAVASGDPARLTDDDDDSWVGFTARWAFTGEGALRPMPVRVVVAVVLGAPICWAYLLFGMLAFVGFE